MSFHVDAPQSGRGTWQQVGGAVRWPASVRPRSPRPVIDWVSGDAFGGHVETRREQRVNVRLDRVAYDRPMDAAAEAYRSELLAPARARLDAFRALEPDWDSYSAAPIAERAITNASYLMHRIAQRPGDAPFFVGPIADGGVELEYRAGDRRVGVDVRPGDTYDVLLVRGKGVDAERQSRPNIPIAEVIRLIEDLLGE